MSSGNIRRRNQVGAAATRDKSLTTLGPSNSSGVTIVQNKVFSANDSINDSDVAEQHVQNRFFRLKAWTKSKLRFIVLMCFVAFIIFLPLLIGALISTNKSVGGVKLVWFCAWLECFWLSLWVAVMLSNLLVCVVGALARLFKESPAPWKERGKRMTVHSTLVLWWLMVKMSFVPIMCSPSAHSIQQPQTPASTDDITFGSVRTDVTNSCSLWWVFKADVMLWNIGIAVILNFVTRSIVQFIALKFHAVNYQGRIEQNNEKMGHLIKLYEFSLQRIENPDSDFEFMSDTSDSTLPPAESLRQNAQKNLKILFSKTAEAAGKAVRSFIGRPVNPCAKRVKKLLRSRKGSKVLARRIYYTYCPEIGKDLSRKDMEDAFESQRETDAAFSMFDKERFGNVSLEHIETICIEFSEERKAVAATVGDIEAVVGSLENCTLWLVLPVSIFAIACLWSPDTGHVIMGFGTFLLSLSWMLIATAQEFLQSIIFVFIKHPFDVGDRVHIYGGTGEELRGDEYFVKEIRLLSTVFRKMEGQVIQASNSVLNTLFIMNQNRTSMLAEGIPLTFKFTTTGHQIEMLQQKLLEIVRADRRHFDPQIIVEWLSIDENHELKLKIYYFFSTNYKNDALRLPRRNKFMHALAVSIEECGIEGPRWRYPGLKPTWPVYTSVVGANLRETPAAMPNPNSGYPMNMRERDYRFPSDIFTDRTSSESIRTESPYIFQPRRSVDAMESGMAGFQS